MKKAYALALAAILFIGAFAATEAAPKKPAAPKSIVGTVTSLSKVAIGDLSKLTAEEAVNELKNGGTLVLLSGNGKSAKVYFIINSDGSIANKKLSSFAGGRNVAVAGKTSVKSGLNWIQISNIDYAK
ncbi:MAG: hypothetical protein ACM3U1_05470 [Chloroflexota bacterium]